MGADIVEMSPMSTAIPVTGKELVYYEQTRRRTGEQSKAHPLIGVGTVKLVVLVRIPVWLNLSRGPVAKPAIYVAGNA